MKALTVGSLFSGIGGLDHGFEQAGFDIRWQVEIDAYCRKVLHKHWPAVPCYEDIRTVGAHNLEPVDVLVGGFPCQDISIAGKGAGIDGERSGLWREYSRLIGELRPRYAVLENTPMLLFRGFGQVLGELAAGGYDAEWCCLRASDFGAPHRRERLFLVAYTDSDRRISQQVQARVFTAAAAPQSTRRVPDWPGGRRVRSEVAGRVRLLPECFPDGMADGIPSVMERQRLKMLGNSVVPAVAQYVAECVKAHAEGQTT